MEFETDKQWTDVLRDALRAPKSGATPIYAIKAELVAHYEQKYPGAGKGNAKPWKQALVRDLLELRGITPANTDKQEYKRQAKNVGKRFEKQRINTPEPKNVKEYAALSDKIGITGYKAPPGGFKVSWSATIWISNRAFDRDYATDFVGEAAQALLDNPRWDTVINAYFTDGGMRSVDDLGDIDPDEDAPVEGVDVLDFVVVDQLEE